MKNLAYIYIDEDMTPRSAADMLKMAKDGGACDVLVFHRENAPFYTAPYKEKLLALFRGAYRNKVRLFIGDDSHYMSGTGFGQVCSVKAVRPKTMNIKPKSEVSENEKIIAERGDECVVVSFVEGNEAEQIRSYPDITNPRCAELVIDCVYKPLLREFEKFKGYEFAGFHCSKACALISMLDNAYMEAVVERFEKEHNRKPDFFELVKHQGDYEEYERLAAVCAQENFIDALRRYCEANGVALMVGGISGEYAEYCENNGLTYVSEASVKGSWQMFVKDNRDVLEWAQRAEGAVLQVGPGMALLTKLWNFIKKNSDAQIVKLNEFKACDKDCYIIISEKTDRSVSFLLEGDWCIADWESDSLYDFDKKGVYTFNRYGFLCIRRKTADMYTEKLPVRVGKVLTKELEYVREVKFTVGDGKFQFKLPEESLSGKYIEFSVGGNYLNVKMGYNRHESITHPFLFPLYDFLCGNECEGNVGDGEIRGIFICEIKKD